MSIPFTKMHGTGNDFAVFDGRTQSVRFTGVQVQQLCHRRCGIGCDQLIIMEPSDQADVFMRIFNADGGQVSSCGNASRCVGWLVMQETGKPQATIETQAGVLQCRQEEGMQVTVNMGAPSFNWQDIPLAEEVDTLHLPISFSSFTGGEASRPSEPSARPMEFSAENSGGNLTTLSMGNPHMIAVVPDVQAVDLAAIGPKLEHHPLFPERVNVSIAQIDNPNHITQRVWERGAGLTLACGTAACAAVAALHSHALVERNVTVSLPGGDLQIVWDEATGHIHMTGAVATSFYGEIPAEWRGPVSGA